VVDITCPRPASDLPQRSVRHHFESIWPLRILPLVSRWWMAHGSGKLDRCRHECTATKARRTRARWCGVARADAGARAPTRDWRSGRTRAHSLWRLGEGRTLHRLL